MKINKSVVISLIIVITLISWFPWFYKAWPINGKVIDLEGNSIDGAVVIAVWVLHKSGYDGSIPVKTFASEESVTNKNGDFEISGWGPKFRPLGMYLESTDPLIIVYKHGYEVGAFNNEYKKSGTLNVYRSSDWNKKNLTVKKINENPDLDELISRISLGINIKSECNYERYPMLMLEIKKTATDNNHNHDNLKSILDCE
jgi:hypothetical protein